jgi:SAM-dependent methyltransferase
MSIEQLAVRHYENAKIVRLYATRSALLPAEERLLEIYRAEIAGRRVLDLGCGAGRTTAHLRALAREYVGIDYSLAMIESCRRQHPGVNFIQGDATGLSMFDPASIEFVLFSYNGLDTMSQGKRLQCLAEVHRVLAPGGLFAFSSHNIDNRHDVVAIDRSLGFGAQAWLRNARYLLSYLLVRKQQVKTDTYSILSDPKIGFRQLTYRIGKTSQVEQLKKSGFAEIAILDAQGELVSAGTVDRETRWFYYVCRKPRESEPAA